MDVTDDDPQEVSPPSPSLHSPPSSHPLSANDSLFLLIPLYSLSYTLSSSHTHTHRLSDFTLALVHSLSHILPFFFSSLNPALQCSSVTLLMIQSMFTYKGSVGNRNGKWLYIHMFSCVHWGTDALPTLYIPIKPEEKYRNEAFACKYLQAAWICSLTCSNHNSGHLIVCIWAPFFLFPSTTYCFFQRLSPTLNLCCLVIYY